MHLDTPLNDAEPSDNSPAPVARSRSLLGRALVAAVELSPLRRNFLSSSKPALNEIPRSRTPRDLSMYIEEPSWQPSVQPTSRRRRPPRRGRRAARP